jgi:alkyl sulfatase BDS1-like metallo-beta-lactamase superfamily hydrolase
VELTATTMIGRMGARDGAGATLTGPRRAMLALLFLKLPLAQLEAAGLKVTGDRALVEAWLAAIDPVPGGFNIIEP